MVPRPLPYTVVVSARPSALVNAFSQKGIIVIYLGPLQIEAVLGFCLLLPGSFVEQLCETSCSAPVGFCLGK